MSIERINVITHTPPPDILVTGHFKEHYGYAVYREHGAGNWLITYTLQGQGLYRQADEDVFAQAGDVVLLQPGTVHDYSVPTGGYWEFVWAHFQPRIAWHSWWQLPEVGQGLFKIPMRTPQVRERVTQVFFKLHNDASTSQAMYYHWSSSTEEPQVEQRYNEGPTSIIQRELALNGLEEILLLAIRENTQKQRKVLDERVQRVLDLIRQDFTTHHDIETLAREVSLSSSRLCHLFKQEVGDSITHVLLSLRLGQAARLLEFTPDSIGRIAEQVGFGSAFYFSRQFRQRFGMSPSDYRAAVATRQ